jgi:hypothetical protein
VTLAEAGEYVLEVTNEAGTVSAGSVRVDILGITSAPVGLSLAYGGSGALVVGATAGSAPVSYQWARNGQSIVGATNATYPIANATSVQAGTYSVRVSAGSAQLWSTPVNVSVSEPVSLPVVGPPQPLTQVRVAGEPVLLTGSVSGGGALSYRWRKDGVLVPGATLRTFSPTSRTGEV